MIPSIAPPDSEGREANGLEALPSARTILLVGKLTCRGVAAPCRVRSISAHAISVECTCTCQPGDPVEVVVKSGARFLGSVQGVAEGRIAIGLAAPVDVEATLAAARGSRRIAEPRFDVDVMGLVLFDGQLRSVRFSQISQSGARLESPARLSRDQLVDIEVPELGRHRAVVRWSEGVRHGLRLLEPLAVNALGFWLGGQRRAD